MEQTTKLSIHTLKIHPRNKEFFDDIEGEIYEQFKKSIKEDGVLTPIIVAPDMTIISGHQRYLACKDIGIELIPAIIREELVDENLKLRQLIASNFGRLSNDPSKFRKAVATYCELNGNTHGGSRGHNDHLKLTQSEIAKELGINERDLRRLLQIENELIPELKQTLDKGFISKTAALWICKELNTQEQQDLLTELVNLIGEKQNKVSNKEVNEYIEKIQLLEDKHKELIEKNTELLTKESQVEVLKQKIKEMEDELLERPTVEKEVIPEDYNETKRKLENSNKDYKQLKEEFDKKTNEISDLKQQIDSLKSVTEEEKYAKKLKDSAIFFCARVDDFIEKTGGFVWLSEHINELPEYERKSYIKAIEMIENWAFAMKSNMKNYI